MVTTVVRGATLSEPSGWLHAVDLRDGRVQASLPVAESIRRRADPNPRGGLRGAKGVSVHAGRLVVANSDALFVLDRAWQVVARLTHPWLGGVHGILAAPDGVWATATSADLLVKLSWGGELLDWWSWRSDLAHRLGLAAAGAFDPDRDYRDPLTTGGSFDVGHLNAVTGGPRGLVVSLGRLLSAPGLRRQRAESAVVRLAETSGAGRTALRAIRRRREGRYPGRARGAPPLPRNSHALVALDQPAGGRRCADDAGGRARLLLRTEGIAVPNHDVLVHGDRLVYCDSNASRLVAVDARTAGQVARVAVPGRPPFARGLERLGPDRLLVGSQNPAAIHVVDLERAAVLTRVVVSEDPRQSVFAIARLPADFEPVPTGVTELSEPP